MRHDAADDADVVQAGSDDFQPRYSTDEEQAMRSKPLEDLENSKFSD
jgi:hypothetical protein